MIGNISADYWYDRSKFLIASRYFMELSDGAKGIGYWTPTRDSLKQMLSYKMPDGSPMKRERRDNDFSIIGHVDKFHVSLCRFFSQQDSKGQKAFMQAAGISTCIANAWEERGLLLRGPAGALLPGQFIGATIAEPHNAKWEPNPRVHWAHLNVGFVPNTPVGKSVYTLHYPGRTHQVAQDRDIVRNMAMAYYLAEVFDQRPRFVGHEVAIGSLTKEQTTPMLTRTPDILEFLEKHNVPATKLAKSLAAHRTNKMYSKDPPVPIEQLPEYWAQKYDGVVPKVGTTPDPAKVEAASEQMSRVIATPGAFTVPIEERIEDLKKILRAPTPEERQALTDAFLRYTGKTVDIPAFKPLSPEEKAERKAQQETTQEKELPKEEPKKGEEKVERTERPEITQEKEAPKDEPKSEKKEEKSQEKTESATITTDSSLPQPDDRGESATVEEGERTKRFTIWDRFSDAVTPYGRFADRTISTMFIEPLMVLGRASVTRWLAPTGTADVHDIDQFIIDTKKRPRSECHMAAMAAVRVKQHPSFNAALKAAGEAFKEARKPKYRLGAGSAITLDEHAQKTATPEQLEKLAAVAEKRGWVITNMPEQKQEQKREQSQSR